MQWVKTGRFYMRYGAALLIGLLSLSMTPVSAKKQLCEGFFPKNNIILPMSLVADGISKAEFDQVLDRLEKVYAPIIAKEGAKLIVERDWQDGEFNAYATQQRKDWIVHFYGGMARAKGMTIEGFTIVTCHEMGHHIGGAPKVKGFMGDNWASNEGQSDYFATLRCLKTVWTDAENANYVANAKINSDVKKSCESAHNKVEDQNACMRAATGAMDLTGAFNTYIQDELIKKGSKTKVPPLNFNTPDSKVVTKTDDKHPQAQCRLDTYYQGALCAADTRITLDNRDPRVGTCSTEKGDKIGVRPRCWYAPL